MEVLSNLTMNFIFVGFIVISLCIVCFVLNYFYKMIILSIINGNLGRESFYYDVLFIVSIILLFLHIDVLRKVLLIIIKYGRTIEN